MRYHHLHHPKLLQHQPESFARNFWQQRSQPFPREVCRISHHQWCLGCPKKSTNSYRTDSKSVQTHNHKASANWYSISLLLQTGHNLAISWKINHQPALVGNRHTVAIATQLRYKDSSPILARLAGLAMMKLQSFGTPAVSLIWSHIVTASSHIISYHIIS